MDSGCWEADSTRRTEIEPASREMVGGPNKMVGLGFMDSFRGKSRNSGRPTIWVPVRPAGRAGAGNNSEKFLDFLNFRNPLVSQKTPDSENLARYFSKIFSQSAAPVMNPKSGSGRCTVLHLEL